MALFLAASSSGLLAQTATQLSIIGPSKVRLGSSAQYSAVVNGASGFAVVWSVNGFIGGTGSTGPISASGIYSPAPTIYAGHSVTISATLKSQPASSASLSTKVLNPLPIISSGSVTQAAPGGPFLLDIRGSGFVAASQLLIANTDIPTTFISSVELQSTISLPAGTTTVNAGVLNPDAEQGAPVRQMLPVQAASTTPSGFANVNIGETPGIAIPATFMGLSHEWVTAQSLMGDSTTGVDTIYRQLLQNLMAYGSGPLQLRIGGGSTDKTVEPASTTAQPFAELVKALRVQFYLGVNLGSDNVALAVAQVKAYVSQMPPGSLDAIEIGNEPDSYPYNGMRPATYRFDDYLAQFNTWKSEILPVLPSSTKLMGPSFGGTYWLTNPNVASFNASEASALALFSQHHYVADGKQDNPGDILLLPGSATDGPELVAAAVATAHQYGIPFRMGEMNSLYNGGETGISNTFQSALWAIDTMFEYANVGVDGVNWHGGGWSPYNYFDIICDPVGGTNTFILSAVHPVYYGLLFFQAATGNGAHLLPVTLNTQANLKAWATIDASGTPRLTLINKDQNLTGTADITLSGYSHAEIYRLIAPSYQSTTGVTFAGQTFDGSSNGVIQGTQTIESVDVSDGVFEVPMPVSSSALIVFTK